MRLLGALIWCTADLARFGLELARVVKPQQDDHPPATCREPYRPKGHP